MMRTITLEELEVPSDRVSNSLRMFEPIYEPIDKLTAGLPADGAQGLGDRMRAHVIRATYYERIAHEVEGIQMEVDEFAEIPAKYGFEKPDALEVQELLRYIRFEPTSEKEYPNGTRDSGRGSMTFSDFMANPKFTAAKLTEAELVAMRLYTTIAYLFMNKPLRDDPGLHGDGCRCAVALCVPPRGRDTLSAPHVPQAYRPLAGRVQRACNTYARMQRANAQIARHTRDGKHNMLNFRVLVARD